MIRKLHFFSAALVAALLTSVPATHANDINHEIAKAYNDGVVRCSNPECAKYLYACFRSFSAATLQEFLACGTQASRLNDNLPVVSDPN